MLQFRLRNLLILIGVYAVALNALAYPSIYWIILLPVVALLLCAFGVSRAVTLPSERVFWLSFLAGLLGYGLTIVGIRVFVFIMSYGSWDPAQNHFVEAKAWTALHGEAPRVNSIINGHSIFDLISFIICLHASIALLLSLVTACIAESLRRVWQR